MAYRAVDIAYWFLQRSHSEGDVIKNMTNMKLQKLVFYAQLVSVIATGERLHGDDTCAWDYGPVAPALYGILREFGGNAITLSDEHVREVFAAQDPADMSGDAYAVGILESVWRKFRGWTAMQLSALTHRRGSPWAVVYARCRSDVITDEIMRKYGFGDGAI